MSKFFFTLFILGAMTIESTGIHFFISVSACFIGLGGLIYTNKTAKK